MATVEQWHLEGLPDEFVLHYDTIWITYRDRLPFPKHQYAWTVWLNRVADYCDQHHYWNSTKELDVALLLLTIEELK